LNDVNFLIFCLDIASQATQPEESQVVDPTQVEYLNYQDQVHHDVTDGGYDQQLIPGPHIPDQDDIATTAVPTVLPLKPLFPGGPENISLT